MYNRNSAIEILPFIFRLFRPSSIIDVGCGTGTWLSVATNMGINDVLGIDASSYDFQNFHIPSEAYQQINLQETFKSDRKFDMCICLEVAEHLAPEFSDTLINTLCNLAPVILFSAAIPGQPGQLHVNCQWPDYWQLKFEKNGFYAYDLVRPAFWNNPNVEWWYKQNVLIYAKPWLLNQPSVIGKVYNYVHPSLYEIKLGLISELYQVKVDSVFYPSISFALKSLAKSLLRPWKSKTKGFKN